MTNPIDWFITKGTVFIIGVIAIMWFAGNVLGMSFSAEDGITTSKAGIIKTATQSTNCFDQVTSGNPSESCTSITIGNTKIGE